MKENNELLTSGPSVQSVDSRRIKKKGTRRSDSN